MYQKYNNLLFLFSKIPKNKKEPTYLDLCRYPYRRFEEICSRLLSFYFSPMKEHGLEDLFLNSLLELLNKLDIRYKNDKIKVITEEYAEGKRIDLLIYSTDFVIGIENKINSDLYNPLDIYKKRIEEYPVKNHIKLVLTLHKLQSKEDLDWVSENGFKAITYSQFFSVLKKKIGFYIKNGNKKYLIYLYDFIETIENMGDDFNMDKQLTNFFFERKVEINELIESYQEFKDNILNIQKEKINYLKELITERTKAVWWAYEGWDLGFSEFKNHNLGIEASFEESNSSPLGYFQIYISSWELNDWQAYDEILRNKFPNNRIVQDSNRMFLHLDKIEGEKEEIILNKLEEYFNYLKSL